MRHRGIARVALAVSFASAVSARALAQCDTTPPALTAFTFSPASIDTTLASQSVMCSMTLTDSPAGTASATCAFTAPDFVHRASCTATTPSSGTVTSGTWSCTVIVPRYSPSGVWTASVTPIDAVGNSASINPAMSGFSSMLTVTSDPDTVAPALSTFTLMPATVTVSGSSQTTTCNMGLTDAKSGVNIAQCQLAAPNSSQTVSCVSVAPSSGSRNSGTFSCTLTIPRYADAGSWTPSVLAIDMAGNVPTSAYMPAASLTVNSSPEDITAPSLTNFGFAPTAISTGSGPNTVTCTIAVADSLAGVDTASCTLSISAFVPPASFVTQSQTCTATAPVSGTRNSGTFQCGVVIPRYSTSGSWTSSTTLTDLAGNSASYPQSNLLNVDCNANAAAETTDRFAADKQTLTWDTVAGATQYDVYRGPLTNLVDANADHLPDGGYGTCQNSRDPVITDTSFLDTDVPAAAQGFFYLVAYKTGGVEKGLGANSFGTPRTVAATCP
ncbi:MAG TPA: hypothetical protein VFV19_08960 [Candidatus Polarisedimenticolaceae bacterium]|nr:hypothetical protein [Candidatus Polarisedimenticolaceae bacterium]